MHGSGLPPQGDGQGSTTGLTTRLAALLTYPVRWARWRVQVRIAERQYAKAVDAYLSRWDAADLDRAESAHRFLNGARPTLWGGR